MAGQYIGLLHAHGGLWVLTIILFLTTVFLIRGGKQKPGKILSMVLRLFFVLMLVTGVWLVIINDFTFYKNVFHWQSYVKGLLAIWLIYSMEMITTRMKKGQSDKVKGLWIQFVIALLLVLYFGYFVIG